MTAVRRRLLHAAFLGTMLACGTAIAAPPLPPPPGTGMCEALQGYLAAGRLRELHVGLPATFVLAGRPASIAFRSRGTGIAPYAVVTDLATGEEFDPGIGDLDGDVRGDAEIVGFGGRHHLLFMQRENAAGRTVALDGGPSCDIERTRSERVDPDSAEPAFCRRVLAGQAAPEVPFTNPVKLTEDALAVRWRHGVTAVGTARLDIANDGRPVDVVQLTMSIRQPDACQVRLWDVAVDRGARLANATELRALAARGIVPDGADGSGDCYGETHFLADGKRVLIERLAHSQSDETQPVGHSIDMLRHGQLRSVCKFTFPEEWTVTPVVPVAPAPEASSPGS